MRINRWVCFHHIYIPPSNSSVLNGSDVSIMDILKSDICMYEGKGNVLIMGDLNNRTGHKQENWMDIIDTHILGSDLNVDFENIPLSTRLNQDGKCNI